MEKTEIAAAIAAGELISVGTINDRLAPISINAAGLEQLGFAPAAKLMTSKLYEATDLPLMRATIVTHLTTVDKTEGLPLMQALFAMASEDAQALIMPLLGTLASAKAPAATNAP